MLTSTGKCDPDVTTPAPTIPTFVDMDFTGRNPLSAETSTER